jgi:hypothetical protein
MGNGFSGSVTVFRGVTLPEEGTPAGYAALIDAFDLPVPLAVSLVRDCEADTLSLFMNVYLQQPSGWK